MRGHTRILDRTDAGFVKGACRTSGGDAAARDVLWLTRSDVAALAPPRAAAGVTYAVPKLVADRLLRFHLVDSTRSEPPFWAPEHVRRAALAFRVERVTAAKGIELRLIGDAVLATAAEPAAGRGYDARRRGALRYDPGRRAFDRFDAATAGNHWG